MKYVLWAMLGLMCNCTVAAAQFSTEITGCYGGQCVVHYDLGGLMTDYIDAMQRIKQTGAQLKIDGHCASACALAADELRKTGQACITRRAVFGFHQAWRPGFGHAGDYRRVAQPGLIEQFHSNAVRSWVQKRGGFPSRGVRTMTYTDARKIWPTC